MHNLQEKQKNDNVADQDAEIDMLMAMGFDVNQARLALDANGGDVDLALDDLLSGKHFSEEKKETRTPATVTFPQPKEASWQTYQQQEHLTRRKTHGVSAASRQSLIDDDAEELLSPKRMHYPDRAVSAGGSAAPNNRERSEVDFKASRGEPKAECPVGAVAVEGPRFRENDLEAGDYDPSFLCDNIELVAARPVEATCEQALPNLQSGLIMAELVPPELPKEQARLYWTRKRILLTAIAVIMLMLIGCAVAGALLATNNQEDDENDQDLESQGNEIVGSDTGPTQPPPFGTTENPVVYTDTIRARSDVGDRFAEFVVISRDGSTIASGAEVGNYVQVYRHTGTAWNQIGQTLPGDGGGDQFGKGVDLNADGTMVIAGAWNADDVDKMDSGHAKVFRLEGDEWKQVGQTLVGDEEEDKLGWYVSMSDDGRTVAVDALRATVGGKYAAGRVRVFTLDDGDNNWVQLGNDIGGESPFEEFGRGMAMSANGRRLAIGASKWNQEKGIVRVFDYSAGTWNQVGQDLTGSLGGDWFGSGVALSADGNVVAIGGDGVKTDAGNKAGLVRAFYLEGCCTWKQYGQDILGEGDTGHFGMHQVSLSDDGCCLAAGASYINNGTGKGYLYALTNNEWNKIVELSGDATSDRFGESVSVSGDCKVAVFGASEFDTTRPGYFRVYYADHERPC